QFAHALLILSRCPAAWPGALDRSRLHLAIVDPQEALRGCADDDEVAQVQVAGECRGVAFPQPPNQFDRMERGWVQQPLSYVHLKTIACVDVLNCPPGRVEVFGSRKVAS